MGTVSTLKKKKEEFSIDDVLSTAAVTKEKSSSSKVPVLTVAKDLQEKAARIREIKDQLDSLSSEYDVLSSEIVEGIEPLRAGLIRKQGYLSSVKIPDSKGMIVGVTWSSSYTKVPLEMKETLQGILGERYDGYFAQKLVIKVKDVGEDALKELIVTVGPEQFSRFFEVDRWIEPTKRYTEEFYTTLDKDRGKLAPLVKQYKASIKVK